MLETKQQALNLFEKTREDFLRHCRWTAHRIAERKGEITIDDVRLQVKLPDGIDGRVFGAVFDKDWEKTGYVNSKQKENHGRPIATWRLKKEKVPGAMF